MTFIRFEAENMTLTNYQVESNNSAASGAALIGISPTSLTGTAATTFTGASGIYDIVVGYFDENDGQAQATVRVGSNQYALNFNQNLGSNVATTQTFVRRTLATGVSVTQGQSINLSGTANQGEWARFDYIEFIPTSSSLPTLSINDAIVTEGNSGTTNMTFTVRLSAASTQTVSVNFATANGTAIAGSDYTSGSGTITFNPGETSKTITVAVRGDLLDEDNETFMVNLSNAINATIADGQGIGTITDNDATPSFRINDVTITEGDSGTSNVAFTVNLSAASGRTATVNFATANGTATAGADYTATSGTLTFAPGETSKTITIPVLADLLDENNETFRVNLSNATNATIADSQGIATITDNDPTPSFRISDVTITEGSSGTKNATFTVSLSASSGRTATVNFATANGTAIATSDYTATSGTLTFAPGETTKTITVPIISDTLGESNETFTVNLSSATNATIADGQGVGTIVDDDSIPSIRISDATIIEGDSGTSNATFTVTLSAASTQTTAVNFTTADGTAIAGSDYTATSG
ncbi:MAG TPA: sodium:calcium exchanger, partial [Cyanobacteria bacterium UBA8803]|nr:sodium:calcium exchanger [Cyanobacteria bacterium UBA8803]